MKTESVGITVSGRVQNLRRSPVRDILSYHGRSDLISFAGGLPGLPSLPIDKIGRAAAGVFEKWGSKALQYGTSEGFPPLREWIAGQLTIDGVPTSPDEVIITGGSQQALDLVARTLMNPGDSIATELPCYNGALQAFALNECKIVEIPSDEDGPIPGELEKIISSSNVKICYLTPSNQNPSGKSYSTARRSQIAAILRKSTAWLFEDDPYGRLIFSGEIRPMISTFMGSQSIVTGSFSKIVSPALRVGYIRAPSIVIEKLMPVKQATDLHTSLISQMILYNYLVENSLDDHLSSLCRDYRAKRDYMIDAINKSDLPAKPTRIPDGGMFLWLEFNEGINTENLAKFAMREGVAIVPGSAFYGDDRGNHFARLNYTSVERDSIYEGIERLKHAADALNARYSI